MSSSSIPKDPSLAFQSWCLESSGKGRIEIGSEQHVFDYYGTLENKPGSYVVALDLPLYGEEILDIGLEKNKIAGSFLKRIQPTKSVTNFFKTWRSWLLARTQNNLPKNSFELEDKKFILTTALSKTESVTLTLHGLNDDSYFSRQTLAYNNISSGESLKLELFTTECRNHAGR